MQTAAVSGKMVPISVMTPMNATDDRTLATSCARGDHDAFEEIYRRWGTRLKSVAFNHLGDRAEAEDAVQETLIKVHRSASTYTGEAAFSTWLLRILVNTCFDMLRKRQRRTDDSELDAASGHHAPSVDDFKRIALRRMLDELPAQKRTVFMLFEVEGLSHAEIAQILDITEGNSKWILFATKKELQQRWLTARVTR